MSESHEQLDLAAGYVLGALTDEERRVFERHLAAGCPECDRALAEWSESTVLLASALPAAEPGPALKARVLDAVRREGASAAAGAVPPPVEAAAAPLPASWTPAPRPEGPPREPARVMEMPRRRVGRGTWVLAAAAAALAMATALSWNMATRLKGELDANRKELARLEERLAEEQRRAEVLLAPGARVAELAITPAGIAELRARATYDPAKNSAVIVFDHFQPPSGKDYELWALNDRGVASLGVIKPDESGHVVVRLENVGDPRTLGGFAVSLEPAGGSPRHDAPTGPVVMAGKFGG